MSYSTPDVSHVKTCSKCGQTKPATTEYYFRDKRNNDGLRSLCKKCYATQSRVYYETHKEEVAEQRRAYYEIHKERKAERARIYYETRKEKVMEYNRAYREAHKGQITEYARAYREAHREQYAEYKRAYHKVHKKHKAEYNRVYYKANKGHKAEYDRAYREANKERKAERDRIWRETNPERVSTYRRNRRARKRDAEGSHTAKDIQQQYKRQKGRCHWCQVKVGKDYHVDHVVPLSRGGSNYPSNLVISCPTCNTSKNNRLPHEWPQGGRLL